MNQILYLPVLLLVGSAIAAEEPSPPPNQPEPISVAPDITEDGIVRSDAYIFSRIMAEASRNRKPSQPVYRNAFAFQDPRKLVKALYQRELDTDPAVQFREKAQKSSPSNVKIIDDLLEAKKKEQSKNFEYDVDRLSRSDGNRQREIERIIVDEFDRSRSLSNAMVAFLKKEELDKLADRLMKSVGPRSLGHPLVASAIGLTQQQLNTVRRLATRMSKIAPHPPWERKPPGNKRSPRVRIFLEILASLNVEQLVRYLESRDEVQINGMDITVAGTYDSEVKSSIREMLKKGVGLPALSQ